MAKFTEWSPELEAALAEPFPPEWVKQKKAGKGDRAAMISFVPWYRYVAKLNALVGGGWSMGTPITMHVADKLVMGIPVTVLGTTRINWGDEEDSEYETVVDERTGEEHEKKTMYGSPVTNAFAQAFKRTCALFGMGLDMYDKGGASAKPVQQQRPAQQSRPTNAEVPKCAKCGGAMWDNRAKKASGEFKANSPDFACKDKTCKHAMWLEHESEGGDAVKLQDLVNQAASLGAITDAQEGRVLAVIESGTTDEMGIAMDWLRTQIQKKKLAAGAV